VAKRGLWFGISPTSILSCDAQYRAVLSGSFANPFADSLHRPRPLTPPKRVAGQFTWAAWLSPLRRESLTPSL